ncbi:hypothetical protein KP79_PYT22389 [Mizuhopecten yessoensis]|uniref:Serine protease n=1 Tax=Mizuhopecten yessoensis TaxID=6573 RepID=A0A210PHM5_MIZYE|nr:hypothetical protein KP79_PYT22389 [Mizuhopecten yessoensis]
MSGADHTGRTLRADHKGRSPFNDMAAKDKPPPEVLQLHKEMVKELGKLFSVPGKAWSEMRSQVGMLDLLSNAVLGQVESMTDLFIELIKSNGNKITYGKYDKIYAIFDDEDVAAGNIIKRFTKSIAEASKTKGKRQHSPDSDSETQVRKSKRKNEKRNISRDSDSETEYENPTSSGSEADGSESNRRKENAGNLRKEHDDTHNASIVHTWQTAMNAVGFIQGPVFSGTGFRVGEDMIMTAYHVVEDITKTHKNDKPDLSKLGTDNVFITFNYLEADNSTKVRKTRKFYFKEQRFSHDKEMDFAILQLRNKDNNEESSYPKAITRFKPVYPEQTFALLGHPDRKPMQLDPKVHIFDPKSDQGKRRLEKMKKWGRKKGKKSAYEKILDERKVLFDCWVQHGASGSPGIEMGSDGEPVCSLMLIHGYPNFVFDDEYKRKEKDHPYMIEQGVTMQAIATQLNGMGSDARKMKQEIFADVFE